MDETDNRELKNKPFIIVDFWVAAASQTNTFFLFNYKSQPVEPVIHENKIVEYSSGINKNFQR